MGGFCFWGVRSLDDMVGYGRVRWGDGGNAEPVYIFLICTVSNLQLLLTYDTSLSLVAHLATSIQPVSFYRGLYLVRVILPRSQPHHMEIHESHPRF